MRLQDGKVWLDERPLDLPQGSLPSGPAQLFLRPHDVEIVVDPEHALWGTISTHRRHAGARRVEVSVGEKSSRVEIEIPADLRLELAREIAFLPRRYRLFPAAQQS